MGRAFGLFLAVAGALLAISPVSAAEPGGAEPSRERVEFTSGKNKLVGDLLLPQGTGPFPVFVFVHGSGPALRNGSGQYPPIWNRFLKLGCACLSWDKPGLGESSGDWVTQTMTSRQNEIQAALEMLRKRPDIDAKRMALWGVSQAGFIIPGVAARGDTALVILVSPGHSSMLDTQRYQLTSDLVLRHVIGIPAEDVKEVAAFLQQLLKLAETGASFEEAVAVIKAAEAKPWFKLLARTGLPTADKLTPELYEDAIKKNFYDPRPDMAKIACPLLVIFGSADAQVDALDGVKAFTEAAKKSQNQDVTITVFAGADHGIRLGDKEARHFAPGYFDLMERWAAAHLK